MRDFFSDIDWSRWSETIWTASARIIVILAVTYLALRLIQRLLGPAIRAAISAQMVGQPPAEIDKRVETLGHVAYRTIWLVAVLVALITILPELGIDPTALLAGAGLLGLAISFGAQSLVKDVISGLFILAENQYSRGDVISIAGVGGRVEDVSPRRTLLRDADGNVHIIPNGQITIVTNMTRARAQVDLVVTVAYGEDLDRVLAVIDRAGAALAADVAWAGDIIEAPKALGADELGDSGVQVRVVGETRPDRQADVARELRRRLKAAFDAEGIEIPFPHRTLVTAGRKAADGIVIRRAPDGAGAAG